MNEKEARQKAEIEVYVYMNIGDIEYACEKRGLKFKTKSRSERERKLIDALTAEYQK